mmetsp:Transcript_32661/g.84325  ORF Transcript_32661/g.84325 Transcript_32661/m.84325 type:complete len:223 (-) Transcript_32661:181-849(-)
MFIAIAFCLFHLVVGYQQNTTSICTARGSNCQSCLLLPGCGWCSAGGGQCWEGTFLKGATEAGAPTSCTGYFESYNWYMASTTPAASTQVGNACSAPRVYNGTCGDMPSCSNCTLDTKCGWCANTNMCTEGTLAGSASIASGGSILCSVGYGWSYSSFPNDKAEAAVVCAAPQLGGPGFYYGMVIGPILVVLFLLILAMACTRRKRGDRDRAGSIADAYERM